MIAKLVGGISVTLSAEISLAPDFTAISDTLAASTDIVSAFGEYSPHYLH